MRRFIVLLTLLIVCSCSTLRKIEYVPVIKTEYISKVDSLVLRDSIYVKEWIKSDTVFLTKEKYKYITKVQRDTVFKTDTIPVIKEVVVPERFVPDYYRRVNGLFWSLILVIAFVLGLKLWVGRK